jgi:hypothetical protein
MKTTSALCSVLLPLALARAQDPLKTIAPAPPVKSDASVEPMATPVLEARAAGAAGAPALVRNAVRSGMAADRLLFDTPGDGTIWAAAAAWKASFSAEGLTFVPFFGSDAPRSWPVRFALESLTVDGVVVPLDQPATVTRTDRRVVIDHGAVAELLDVGPAGIEQTFALARRPGAGDVVVRVRVDTEMIAAKAGDGVVFQGERGRVEYGAAFAVDATSNRTPLTQRFVDGGIEITVPAAVTAGAAYPLAIDPLIRSFPVNSTSGNQHGPDIVYDGNTDRYTVVWEYDYSVTDHDIYCQVHNSDGSMVSGSLLAIDVTTTTWVRPRCAANGTAVLTVAERGPLGLRRVWGRQTFPGTPAFPGNQFEVTSQAPIQQECFNADVGGMTSGLSGNQWLVVFERVFSGTDHDILGQRVQGSQPFGLLFGVDASFSTFDSAPSIARSNGDAPSQTTGWPIVWQRRFGASDEDILGALVDSNGAIVRPTFTIDSSSRTDTRPVVSSVTDDMNGQRFFVVAYEGLVAAGDRDIFLRAF